MYIPVIFIYIYIYKCANEIPKKFQRFIPKKSHTWIDREIPAMFHYQRVTPMVNPQFHDQKVHFVFGFCQVFLLLVNINNQQSPKKKPDKSHTLHLKPSEISRKSAIVRWKSPGVRTGPAGHMWAPSGWEDSKPQTGAPGEAKGTMAGYSKAIQP